jgi:hypothetical protein
LKKPEKIEIDSRLKLGTPRRIHLQPHQMESFLQSYHIPCAPFKDLLKTTNSLFTGSAALALYLQQEDIEPAFIPNNLNLLVQDTHCLFFENGHLNQKSTVMRFSTFLLSNGYNLTTKFESDQAWYQTLKQIQQVLSFLHPSGTEVHLIVLIVSDLQDYMNTNFDLSACCTWYDARTDRFETADEITINKEISILPGQHPYTDTLRTRIEKYVSRGFTLVLPASIHSQDKRLTLGKPGCPLIGIKAYDMMELEEVDAVRYLSASKKHLLIKSGEQYYAFHRTTLYDCMQLRRVIVPCSSGAFEAFETPFNQTILHHVHRVITYEDFSLFELIFAYNVSFNNGRQKSIFSVNCYTVEGWKKNTVGAIFAPPSHVDMVLPLVVPIVNPLHSPAMALAPIFEHIPVFDEDDLELQELLLSEWRQLGLHHP